MKKLLLLLLISASCLGQQSAFFRAQQAQYAPALNIDFTTGTLDSRVTYSGQAGTQINSSGLIETVANNVPRIDYDLQGGQNYWSYSEDFSQSTWVKSGASITSTTIVSPAAMVTTAWKLVESSATSGHSVRQDLVSSTVQTFSLYAKAGERSWLWCYFGGMTGASAWFNLSAGTVGTTEVNVSASMTDAGNGWWRISLRKISALNSGNVFINITTANGVTSYAGDGSSGIYINGGQIVDGSSLTNYARTLSSPASSTALRVKGALIEPAATNYLTYSGDFTNGSWTKLAATVGSTGSVGKRNGVNAYRLTETNATGSSHTVYQTATTASMLTATASVLLKQGTRRYANIRINRNTSNSYAALIFDTQTGVISQTSVTGSGDIPTMSTTVSDWGGGWWRVSLTAIYTGASTTHQLGVNLSNAATATLNAYGEVAYDGDGVSYIDVDAAQLEAGAIPTSWILTQGSSVLRFVDDYRITSITGWLSQKQGTVVTEFIPLTAQQNRGIWSLNDGTGTNRIDLRSSGAAGQISVSNTGQNVAAAASVNVNLPNRIGVSYAVGSHVITRNAQASTSGSPAALPTVTQLQIDNIDGGTANCLIGYIRWLRYYNARHTQNYAQYLVNF